MKNDPVTLFSKALFGVFALFVLANFAIFVVPEISEFNIMSEVKVNDERCASLFKKESKDYDSCTDGPEDYFTKLIRERATSELIISAKKHSIPLRRKWPLYGYYIGKDASYYIDERLFLDTGAEHSMIFSKDKVAEDKFKSFTGSFGKEQTYFIEKRALNAPGLSIDNVNNIDYDNANKYLTYAGFSGYMGLDFMIAAKTICFDVENSQITAGCFQQPDEVGRILVIDNSRLYLPIQFDGKQVYALFDSGFGVSFYRSPKCKKEDTIGVHDAFGNTIEVQGESKTGTLKMGTSVVENFLYFCENEAQNNSNFIIGSTFMSMNIRSIEFNFEDNTFGVSFR